MPNLLNSLITVENGVFRRGAIRLRTGAGA